MRALGDLETDRGAVECAGSSARSSSSMSVGSKVWRSETLMLAVSGAPAIVLPARASCAQTRSSTHTPIGTIRPFSSAMEMKSFGAISAAQRVIPAQQRLEAGDFAGAQRDDGLIDDAELFALDGAAQVRLQSASARRPARACGGRRSRSVALPRSLARYIAVSASRSTASAER